MTNAVETPQIKNKYLKNLAKIFDVRYVGKSFWSSELFYLKNKNDDDSKVIYAFELENGSKLELVDIYNGAMTRISSFSTFSSCIATGTPYQMGCILNSVFACFVKSIEYNTEKDSGVFYTYHKGKNIVDPSKEAIFTFGEFELQVFINRVEIMLPAYANRIIGMYKKLPIVGSPDIEWSFGKSTGFLEEADLYWNIQVFV